MWLNSHTFKNSDTQWQHPGGRRALWKVQTSKEKVTTVGESIKTWLKGTTVLTEWMDYLQLQQSNTHVQGKGKKKPQNIVSHPEQNHRDWAQWRFNEQQFPQLPLQGKQDNNFV